MDLIKSIKQLMIESPFYGLFLMNMNKEYSDSVPTAAVVLEGINTKLLVNKEFWNHHKDEEQMAILIHESLHICFQHLLMADSFPNQFIANIAHDMEVNCYVQNLPSDAVTVESVNKEFGLSLKPKMGSKWYYDELEKLKKEDPEKYKKLEEAYNPLDDHGSWKDLSSLDSATKKIIKNQVEHHIKETAKSVHKMRGKIPAGLEAIVSELLTPKPPIFNWKAYFRRLLSNSYETYTKKSRRKESKRFPGNSGIKVKSKHHILVGVDTSGSVSDKELSEFFGEINHIYKAGGQVTVCECDAAIQRIYSYKGKFDGKITGRGGTDFKPMVDYYNANRKKYSVMVIFSDGYAPINELKPMQQLMWVITSNGCRQEYPGHKIYIPR